MGLFEKFAARFCDRVASNYNRMSRNRDLNLTPEQRERVREVSNNWKDRANRFRDDD